MECPRCGSAVMEYIGLEDMRCPVCNFSPFHDDLKARPVSAKRAAVASATGAVAAAGSVGEGQQPGSRRVKPPLANPLHGQPPVPIDPPNATIPRHTPGLSEFERLRFEGRFREAHMALGRGDDAAAREALHAAAAISDLSDDVWLLLAALAEDAAAQRDYLEQAVGCNPNNALAVTALLELKQWARPSPRRASKRLEDGQVAAEQIACPRCGGNLDYDVGEKEVVCKFCGFRIVDADDLTRSGQQTALQAGLLSRKQQARAWNIGGQWLRCANCGATTTLSRRTLTNTCRFCDSRQILQEGVNIRFEQPDFILPFALDEAQARAAIREKLRSGFRALTRFFADPIERIDLHAVYLPYWIFDAEMSVNWSWTNAPDHGQYPILLGDVPFFAADSLPARLLEKVEPYDLLRGVDYDPRLLAVQPAELYSIDVDRASLDVRPKLGRMAMRRARPSLQVRRPSRGYSTFGDSDSSPGRLKMNASTRYMSYRFGLFPVWVARLIEADGDTRQVVVNGQLGAVALGKLEKSGTT